MLIVDYKWWVHGYWPLNYFNILVYLKYFNNKMSKKQNYICKKLGFEGRERSFWEERCLHPALYVIRRMHELAKGSNKGKFSVWLHTPHPSSAPREHWPSKVLFYMSNSMDSNCFQCLLVIVRNEDDELLKTFILRCLVK